jgi:hypothetical protein
LYDITKKHQAIALMARVQVIQNVYVLRSFEIYIVSLGPIRFATDAVVSVLAQARRKEYDFFPNAVFIFSALLPNI